MKNLLITGGCGFIGAGFTRHMIKTYPFLRVINIDCLYTCSTQAADLTTSQGNYHFVKGDIKDTSLIKSLLDKYEVDTIVHFAAQSHVDTSFTNPLLYTQDNIVGTHSMLEAVRSYGNIKRFIHISTDEVYGENANDDGVKTEESLLKPTNPYAASKAAAEMLVHSYMHSYQLPVVIVRSNNVYGPGQFPEKVIPKFMFQLLDNKKLTLQGSGQQLRSFLFLDDAVNAISCILFQGQVGGVYNISSKDEISIVTLAKMLLTELKPGAAYDEWVTHIEDRNFNDQRYWITSEPLKKLGWKQEVDLEEGLKRTIEWFRQVDRARYWAGNEPQRHALIWGGHGWIGGHFIKALEARDWKVTIATSRADQRDAVLAEIAAVGPTHLVSLIGRTHGPGFTTIDYLEQPGKLVENMRDNLYGPLCLAEASRTTGKHLLYMGTGCIFDYDEEHPLGGVKGFSEEDKPNFFGSGYSVVKGFTDQLMGNYPTVLNVRIRMPISSEDCPRNFITKIINYKKINSIPNSMTVMDDILPLLVRAMEDGVVGALNATNPGVIDHSTILGLYKELQNHGHSWEEIDKQELLGSCVKAARSNNMLGTQRIEELYPELPNIYISVKRLLEENKFAGQN
jgi:UDP-glucose 4,6-dehydratase